MMNDLPTEFPTPEVIARHMLEARRLRALAMRDMIHAMARAMTPKRKAETAPKAARMDGAVA